MNKVHQGNATAVLCRLVREGIPKRLTGYSDVLNRSQEPSHE